MLTFLRGNARFLGAGALLTLSSSYGQTFFISVFAGRIQGEFGLSHGAWGGTYALATTVSALVMVWAGTTTDHFRVRVLGPLALIGLSVACLTMSRAGSVPVLIGAIFLLRFFGQGMLSHIAVVAMARWYVARRGRALSVAGLGYSAGEALLPLIFVSLLAIYDWRTLWLFAALLALVTVPVVRVLLTQERTPRDAAARSESAGMDGRHWHRGEALGHPLLWLCMPVLLGFSAFLTAFFFQQVHLAEIKGWSHAGLVALFPAYTATAIAAMVGAGWAVDRWGTGRLATVPIFLAVAGFAALWAAETMVGALVTCLLIGGAHGAQSTVMSAFWAEFYGTRHLGGIRALATAVGVLGSAIGPGLTGVAIDLGVDFAAQAPFIAAYFLVAAFALWSGVRTARLPLPAA